MCKNQIQNRNQNHIYSTLVLIKKAFKIPRTSFETKPKFESMQKQTFIHKSVNFQTEWLNGNYYFNFRSTFINNRIQKTLQFHRQLIRTFCAKVHRQHIAHIYRNIPKLKIFI